MFKKLLFSVAAFIMGYLFISAPVVQEKLGYVTSKETSRSEKEIVKAKKNVKIININKTESVKFNKVVAVKPKTKQVRKLTLDPSRSVHIVGPIGFSALGAAEKIAKLSSESDEPIYVVLSSPGGSVIAGAAVIAAIQSSNVPVYTICYSFCASMASMIHQYGTRRYATDRSVIMFHPASARLDGNLDELYSFTTAMIKFASKIEKEVAARIGWKYKDYKTYVANELWVDSDEAKVYNVVDQIIYTRFPGMGYGAGRLFQEEKPETLRINSKDLVWIYEGAL